MNEVGSLIVKIQNRKVQRSKSQMQDCQRRTDVRVGEIVLVTPGSQLRKSQGKTEKQQVQ